MMNYTPAYFKRLHDDAKIPARKHNGDAGYDLTSIARHVIPPRTTVKIHIGVAVEMPSYVYGQIANRSSWAWKGLSVEGGVIDSNYRGEIIAMMYNRTEAEIVIEKGVDFAQLIFIRIAEPHIIVVDELSETTRGSGAFGSSDTITRSD